MGGDRKEFDVRPFRRTSSHGRCVISRHRARETGTVVEGGGEYWRAVSKPPFLLELLEQIAPMSHCSGHFQTCVSQSLAVELTYLVQAAQPARSPPVAEGVNVSELSPDPRVGWGSPGSSRPGTQSPSCIYDCLMPYVPSPYSIRHTAESR